MTRTGEGAQRIADGMDKASVGTLGEWMRKRWEGAAPEEREEARRQSERRRVEIEEEAAHCQECSCPFDHVGPFKYRGVTGRVYVPLSPCDCGSNCCTECCNCYLDEVEP